MMTERLPLMYIGDVHLNARSGHARKCIGQGHRGVRVPTGVKQRSIGPLRRALQMIDKLALTVALEGANLVTVLLSRVGQFAFDLLESS